MTQILELPMKHQRETVDKFTQTETSKTGMETRKADELQPSTLAGLRKQKKKKSGSATQRAALAGWNPELVKYTNCLRSTDITTSLLTGQNRFGWCRFGLTPTLRHDEKGEEGR